MANDRRTLPYKVIADINLRVLRSYRAAAQQASDNISSLLISATTPSDEELVLRRLEKSTFVEDLGMMFDSGDTVMIQVGDQWQPATVVSASGTLKVRRGDGSVRNISDLTKVTKDPSAGEKSGFTLEKFGVRVPEGTQSFEIESALLPITECMNKTPLLVNKATWEINLLKAATNLAELTEKCREVSGDPEFKHNSSKSCIAEFGVKRRLPLGRVGSSGVQSVDKEVLQHLANIGDDLAPVVMAAREAQARFSQLEKWAPFAKDGFVQTNWDQFGQPHGRYTSDNPSLQNRVVEIRETIEPKPGFSFVSADWGMAEYVTWASLSKDAYLAEIFEGGRDLHSEMGESLHHLNPDREMMGDSVRKFGKTTNFAILYRMQSWTLAKALGVQAADADKVLAEYASKAPEASVYAETILEKAARNGFVETAFGRRLYCQELVALKGGPLHQLQKTVWHHHNAGTAAELLKLKTVDVMRALAKAGYHTDVACVALNMHDELILEVEDSAVEPVSRIMYEEMKKRVPGFLPFTVDLRVGKNWFNISK